ncbi:MAG: hypothetical protein R3B90_04855 [Planctomycetaceae bacterium]
MPPRMDSRRFAAHLLPHTTHGPLPPPQDIIEEFRLRRWARENFVAFQHRDPAWTEVVLHEMAA